VGARRLVVAGLQSEYCVRSTSLGALSRGLQVVLVSNGHSTYDGRDRKADEVSASINAELGERVRLVNAADVRFD
jgi:nicotinamidase-related amidase